MEFEDNIHGYLAIVYVVCCKWMKKSCKVNLFCELIHYQPDRVFTLWIGNPSIKSIEIPNKGLQGTSRVSKKPRYVAQLVLQCWQISYFLIKFCTSLFLFRKFSWKWPVLKNVQLSVWYVTLRLFCTSVLHQVCC